MRGIFARFQDIIFSVDNISHLRRKNLEFYKAKVTFIDGSNLRISEKVVSDSLEKYSYYWLDGRNQIIIGWDNAPHHKELPNFPHHKHTYGRILASYETNLDAVLKVIKRIVARVARAYRTAERSSRMRLVYSFRIDQHDKRIYPTLKEMSMVSKNLYNQSLFEIKSNYEKTGKTLSYAELDALMKEKMNLDGDINYRLLPAKVAQQTLMLVSQNVKSFFSALSDYKEYPQKYQARPQFPVVP